LIDPTKGTGKSTLRLQASVSVLQSRTADDDFPLSGAPRVNPAAIDFPDERDVPINCSVARLGRAKP
jgi:hypothetical protein